MLQVALSSSDRYSLTQASLNLNPARVGGLIMSLTRLIEPSSVAIASAEFSIAYAFFVSAYISNFDGIGTGRRLAVKKLGEITIGGLGIFKSSHSTTVIGLERIYSI